MEIVSQAVNNGLWNGIQEGGFLEFDSGCQPLENPSVNYVQTTGTNWNWYPYCNCRSDAFERVQEAILDKVRVAVEDGDNKRAKNLLDLAVKLKELK